jgi:hypothetical protein
VSDTLRKHELECLRLEADCLAMAARSHHPLLWSHFARMAGNWATLAAQGPMAMESEQVESQTTGTGSQECREDLQDGLKDNSACC